MLGHMAQPGKNLSAMQETWVQSLGWEDPLEKEKTTHSSILAWRIAWAEKSMESQRVRHDRVTFTLSQVTEQNQGDLALNLATEL